ncbi:MAG TPA: Mut7-C RNAse domain-containing protein [Methanomassiliicoccales archaeon]|nr:Mut7-C RNAse domain-containing protein [Methanomassiliicoccales archaeon]
MRPCPVDERPRFVADEMFGSLAKWLRIMGYDTLYERDTTDDEIIERLGSSGRVLLTRDKVLAKRTEGHSIYIISDDVDEQVRQTTEAFQLVFDEGRTRCAICNGELSIISREDAAPHVPPRSLAMADRFYRCGHCQKTYWNGTHWKNIQDRMEELTGSR